MKTYYLMNYVPVSAETKYGYCATESDWDNRHEVWNFKDGICSQRILEGLAEGIKELSTPDSVVCFIPASTSAKTENRYGDVSLSLQRMTGIPCSYRAISKESDGESGYMSGKKMDPAADFVFETNFFRGKKVILIDDVVTRGRTLDCTARRLLERGAKDVVALTVARTINPIFQSISSEKQCVDL